MTLRLSTSDREILGGQAGPALRMAMSILTRIARVVEADRLIDISAAHIDSAVYLGQTTLDYAETLARLGGRVVVPTTLNVSGIDEHGWQQWAVSAEWAEGARRQMVACKTMGWQPTWMLFRAVCSLRTLSIRCCCDVSLGGCDPGGAGQTARLSGWLPGAESSTPHHGRSARSQERSDHSPRRAPGHGRTGESPLFFSRVPASGSVAGGGALPSRYRVPGHNQSCRADAGGGGGNGYRAGFTRAFEFLGGYDPATGEITDRRHPLSGQMAAGRVLVLPSARGSSTTTAVLLEAIQRNTAPAPTLRGAASKVRWASAL